MIGGFDFNFASTNSENYFINEEQNHEETQENSFNNHFINEQQNYEKMQEDSFNEELRKFFNVYLLAKNIDPTNLKVIYKGKNISIYSHINLYKNWIVELGDIDVNLVLSAYFGIKENISHAHTNNQVKKKLLALFLTSYNEPKDISFVNLLTEFADYEKIEIFSNALILATKEGLQSSVESLLDQISDFFEEALERSFQTAANENNNALVKAFLEKAIKDIPSNAKGSAICTAVKSFNLELLQLLSDNIDENDVPHEFRTRALQIASDTGGHKEIYHLLRYLSYSSKDIILAIQSAIKNKHINVIIELSEYGFELIDSFEDKWRVYKQCLMLGNIELIKLLHNKLKNDLNTNRILEILDIAEKSDNVELFELILKNQEFLLDFPSQKSFFEKACASDNPRIAAYLFEDLTDKLSAQSKGQMLFKWSQNNKFKIIDIFLERFADSFECSDVNLALTTAAQYGHTQVIRAIVKKGDKALSCAEFAKALYYAAKYSHLQTVLILLEHRFADQILHDDRANILNHALHNDKILESIIEKFGTHISRAMMKNLLLLAINKRNLGAIAVILEHQNQLTNEDKAECFVTAMTYFHNDFDWLVLKMKIELSNNLLGMVLKKACSAHNDALLKILLTKYKSEISAKDKGSALLASVENITADNPSNQIYMKCLHNLMENCKDEIPSEYYGYTLIKGITSQGSTSIFSDSFDFAHIFTNSPKLNRLQAFRLSLNQNHIVLWAKLNSLITSNIAFLTAEREELFCCAISHKRFDWVEQISNFISPEAKERAFFIAVGNGYVEVFLKLCPFEFIQQNLNKSLELAVKSGMRESMDFVLKINHRLHNEALSLAVRYGKLKLLESLIDRVDRVAISSEAKVQALFLATEHGHTEIIRFILARFNDDFSRENKLNAIHKAQEKYHKPIFDLLAFSFEPKERDAFIYNDRPYIISNQKSKAGGSENQSNTTADKKRKYERIKEHTDAVENKKYKR